MKRKEIKRLLGLVATATVITGCRAEVKQTSQQTETPIEVKAEDSTEEITEAEQEQTPTPVQSYTISFDNSGNESVEVKDGEETEIPEYKGIKLTDKIDFSAVSVDDEGNYRIGTDRVCPADAAEIDENNKTINLKNVNIPYQLRYVVNSEDDTVYPIQVIEKEEPTNSGICVLLTYEDKEDGTKSYTYKGITDMILRPIDNAEIYRGEFKGWSEEQTATAAEYVMGDKVSIGKNMSLYPIFDTEGMDELSVAEGSEFEAIIDDIKGIVATAKWGNISVNDKNRVVTDRASSTVDQVNGKVYAKEEKSNSSSNINTTAQDNYNDFDIGEQGIGSDASGMAVEWGVPNLDVGDCDGVCVQSIGGTWE